MKVIERLEERYEVLRTRVIAHHQAHYEAQEVPFGVVYKWCPECVVMECGCGKRETFTISCTVCECGTDHAGTVREGLAARWLRDEIVAGDEVLHPWRYANREGVGLPC